MSGIYENRFLRLGFFASYYCFWNICKDFYACAEGGLKGNGSILRNFISWNMIVVFYYVSVRIFGQFFKDLFFFFGGEKFYNCVFKIFPNQFGRQNVGYNAQQRTSKSIICFWNAIIYLGNAIIYFGNKIKSSTEKSNTDVNTKCKEHANNRELMKVIGLSYKWIDHHYNYQNHICKLMNSDEKYLKILSFWQQEIVFYFKQIHIFFWVSIASCKDEPKRVKNNWDKYNCGQVINANEKPSPCQNTDIKKCRYAHKTERYRIDDSEIINKHQKPQKINKNYVNDNARIFAFGQGGIAA